MFLIKTYPLSLDDFNEPCTAVIVKKNNWNAKFLYAIHLSAPTWLKRFNIFLNLFLSAYSKKGFLGAFKYLASTFYLFVKKRVLVRDTYILEFL